MERGRQESLDFEKDIDQNASYWTPMVDIAGR
jgi:hypothetical protein